MYQMQDVTPATWVALIAALLGVLAAFGVPISEEQSVAVLALAGVVSAMILKHDKDLRVARNETAQQEMRLVIPRAPAEDDFV